MDPNLPMCWCDTVLSMGDMAFTVDHSSVGPVLATYVSNKVVLVLSQ